MVRYTLFCHPRHADTKKVERLLSENNIILVKEPGKTAPVEKDCPKDQGN